MFSADSISGSPGFMQFLSYGVLARDFLIVILIHSADACILAGYGVCRLL